MPTEEQKRKARRDYERKHGVAPTDSQLSTFIAYNTDYSSSSGTDAGTHSSHDTSGSSGSSDFGGVDTSGSVDAGSF